MSEEEDSGTVDEAQIPRRHDHKGGKINRFEPINTREIMASSLTVSCFKHMGCFEFCERVQQVQNHLELTRLFIINLHDKQANLVGVNFEMSTNAIAAATGIPIVGERWFKKGNLDMIYFKPYLKPRYKDHNKSIFPFSHLLYRYVPMMRIIMKYFTCEGRFSHL